MGPYDGTAASAQLTSALTDGGIINGILVSAIKPTIAGASSGDGPGFFIQALQAGPALFVRVDPATLAGGLAVGDVVDLNVLTLNNGDQRFATTVSNVVIQGRGHDVTPLAADVTNVNFNTFTMPAAVPYESRLVSLSATVAALPGGSGASYESVTINNPGSAVGGNLRFRAPASMMRALDLGPMCQLTMVARPLSRSVGVASVNAWEPSHLQSVVCPAAELISAASLGPTTVATYWSHNIKPSSVSAGAFVASGGLSITAATAISPREIRLTTSAQSAVSYTLTPTASLLDVRDVAVAPTPATFSGATAPLCNPRVVISQVYPLASSPTSPFNQDFVELHNRTNQPASLQGWALQIATGTSLSWQPVPLSGTIPAGGYFLIGLGGPAGSGAALPAPNVGVTSPILNPNGKIALTTTTTPLFEQCPAGVVDFVGYGTGTVNCSEGNMPLDTPLAPTAWARKGSGATNACTDTNSNGADFELRTPSPKNTSSAANACSCP